MIYNIRPGTFNNNGIRNGDLIAMINFIQWYRKQENNPNIKFHIEDGVLLDKNSSDLFFNLFCELTDCFSPERGDEYLPFNEIMLWDFRDITGDHVVINNPYKQKKKIVMFPVYDAQYNMHRNWKMSVIEDDIKYFSELYPDHEKYICVKDLPAIPINTMGFQYSTDFMTNMIHIMEAEIFIGGDTGSSHFASALEPGPSNLLYHCSSLGMIHTLPFYFLQNNKGTLKTYFINFYKSTYKGNIIP